MSKFEAMAEGELSKKLRKGYKVGGKSILSFLEHHALTDGDLLLVIQERDVMLQVLRILVSGDQHGNGEMVLVSAAEPGLRNRFKSLNDLRNAVNQAKLDWPLVVLMSDGRSLPIDRTDALDGTLVLVPEIGGVD